MTMTKKKRWVDPTLLVASGGDTVKLFDVSADAGGDQSSSSCVLSYAPSPGFPVHSLKWNHTKMVVASAGKDQKISLWRKNGQSRGTIPASGTDAGDGIEESILSISFSNKSSRYICSGGSGQVVRIWDLQRKRCIKWLRGHTSTITRAAYYCKDDFLASIGVNGSIVLHNLTSGAKAAELKDPDEQSTLLDVAGDDGSVCLWDKNVSNPKISWLKQHSAPPAGISFSPSNDKIIACVGLDKKLYTFDSGSKRPTSCIYYESPFSSMALKEDGLVLAAGTNNGRIVFYDVRAKPQPFSVLTAYGSSEAVTSLCWKRAKPVRVDESTCSAEAARLGGGVEDSILMPDSLPTASSSSLASSSAISGSWNLGRSSFSLDTALVASTSGAILSSQVVNTSEETSHRSHLWPEGTLAWLNSPCTSYNVKDDEMGIFSPLMTPITPTLNKLWNDSDGAKKDHPILDRKPSFLIPSASQRFPSTADRSNDHPILGLKSSSSFGQDHGQTFGETGSTPAPSSKSEDSSVTPPEAWGGERPSDQDAYPKSHFTSTAGTVLSGYPDSCLASSYFTYTYSRTKDLPSVANRLGYSENFLLSSLSSSFGPRGNLEPATSDPAGSTLLAIPCLFSSYAERRSADSTFDGTSILAGSPKLKKTGAETREELLSTLLSRSYTSTAVESVILPPVNGGTLQAPMTQSVESQPPNSFSLQLFERTLVETMDSFQKSIHGDMRKLQIEVLRQSHMN